MKKSNIIFFLYLFVDWIIILLFESEWKKSKYNMSTVQNRLLISFVVAWIAYALTYFLRKPLGVVSDHIPLQIFFLKYSFDFVD